jgi:hypothetical protein
MGNDSTAFVIFIGRNEVEFNHRTCDRVVRPVLLAYQPPASNIFLSEQTSHQQSANNTFLSEQTSHRPPAKRTGWSFSPSAKPDRIISPPNDCNGQNRRSCPAEVSFVFKFSKESM